MAGAAKTPQGSKAYLNDFYSRLASAEGCVVSPAPPCQAIARAQAQAGRADLRTTRGRRRVLATLAQVTRLPDCSLCEAGQGAQVDLVRPWRRSKQLRY